MGWHWWWTLYHSVLGTITLWNFHHMPINDQLLCFWPYVSQGWLGYVCHSTLFHCNAKDRWQVNSIMQGMSTIRTGHWIKICRGRLLLGFRLFMCCFFAVSLIWENHNVALTVRFLCWGVKCHSPWPITAFSSTELLSLVIAFRLFTNWGSWLFFQSTPVLLDGSKTHCCCSIETGRIFTSSTAPHSRYDTFYYVLRLVATKPAMKWGSFSIGLVLFSKLFHRVFRCCNDFLKTASDSASARPDS